MKLPKQYLIREWDDFNTTQRNYSLTTTAYNIVVVSASPIHILAERLTNDYCENFAKHVSDGCPGKYYTEAVTWFNLYKKDEIYNIVLAVLQKAEKEERR